MKYLTFNTKIAYILNPFLFLLGAIIFFCLPFLVLYSFYLFWIPLFITIYFFISPLGKKRLAHDSDDVALRLPLKQWLFAVVLLELLLLGMFLGIAYISGEAFNINTSTHPHLFVNTLRYLLTQYGLFPWAIYAVVGIGMGMLAYRDQTPAYFSTLLKPLSHQDVDGVYSLVANVGMRRLTLFGVAISMIFMALLMVSCVISLPAHIMNGFLPTTLVGTSFIVMCTLSKQLHYKINHLFSKHVAIFWEFLLYGISIALILLVLSVMVVGTWPSISQTFAVPPVVTQWINYNWYTAWLFFSVLWWLFLTPLVGAFIARISRGHTVRIVLAGTMFLPIVLSVILLLPVHWPESNPMLIRSFALFSFLVALPTLINHKQFSNAIMAYFPKNGEIKPRDHHPFLKSLTQTIGGFLCVFLVIGINGISLLIFSATLVPAFIIVFTTMAIVKIVIRASTVR
ncbi:MAG: hypothetical protein A3J38_06125 [Gammaproteobacteria bacterium RIFCSPHIGHO2_12_FULL_45_9]|nr:MAG: hypothetical protein A3J38_06125 [Gammaproteobacteria bacterium RIFCSPHIGHO2_12_FULL_45_9]